MHIKTVRSNVKIGCDVEIGPKTVIVGPNGSGKSTIINAIELALTGRAGDIAGRVEVAREADIMALAPAGATELEALATFDTGEVAAYRTSGSTAKAKKATGDKPVFVRHEEVLPIRTLREAVLGSPQTARKYLLGKVSGGTTRGDVRSLLPEQARPLWDTIAATFPQDVPVADVLVGVLESAASKVRDATSEAKTARGAAKTVGDGFAAPPTDAEIAAAKEKVREARVAFTAADGASLYAHRLEQAHQKVDRLTIIAVEKAEAFQRAEEAFNALPPPPANGDTLFFIGEVMRQSVVAGECLPCGGTHKTIPPRLAEVDAAVSANFATKNARDAAQEALFVCRREAERSLAAVEIAEADVESIIASYPGASVVSRADAEAALDAAQKTLATLTATRDNWAIVQRAESNAIAAEQRAAEWKMLKAACEEAVGVTLDKALATFVAKVQSSLPPTDKFDMKLRDGEREVVQFGLVGPDGKLRTALSGAEWARVMAAMAEACVEPGRFAVIIPEERAFDPKTLSSVLKSLSACEHQVIIASPIAPKPLPKGWTLVERVALE